MNLLDIIIVIILVFLVVKGIYKGFFRETASLAGIILGILLGKFFLPETTGLLKSLLPSLSPLLHQIIGFTAVLILIMVICNLLGWALNRLAKKVLLGWLDRTLGALLSIVKGMIVIYLMIIFLTMFLPGRAPIIAESKLALIITSACQSIVRNISPDTLEKLKRNLTLKNNNDLKKLIQDKE